MSWFLALLILVAGMGDYTPTSDGAPSDESIPATYTANKVVGDVYPQGADLPGQQFVDSISQIPILSLNSDPTAGDVGFLSGLNRGIQAGIPNGDFSMPPPDPSAPISDDNPLPFWTYIDGSDSTATWVATTATGSGGSLVITPDNAPAASTDPAYLQQEVEVPASAGQQWRGIASVYVAYVGPSSKPYLAYQYLASDKTTTIGSEVLTSLIADGPSELKVDMGLVPTNAGYVRIRVGLSTSFSSTYPFYEIRAAFLPAEATVGLGSLSASTGAITTTETVVKRITIPANTLVVGSVYAIEAWATVTSSAANNVTLRLRLGTTSLSGTILDNINPTATTTASADPFMLRGIVTVYSIGATGTVQVGLSIVGSNTQPFSVPVRTDMPSAAVTIDTTVANILELTAQTGAGTTSVNFRHAVISCLIAS